MKKKSIAFLLSITGFICAAYADQPHPWQIGFQEAVTPVMEKIEHLHHYLLSILAVIATLVVSLLIYVIWRFREKKNPIPSKTTHNTLLEIVWATIPAIIVLTIMIPSLKLTYFMDRTAQPEMTLKVIGHQWYWSYEYPETKLEFESRIVTGKDLKPGDPRLLTVDNKIYLPVDTNIRILTTSQDVLHSWAVPAFGIKKDSIPGRLNETWVRVNKIGTYRGQCSEICGMDHGFMPIEIEVVSKEAYQTWLQEAKKKFS